MSKIFTNLIYATAFSLTIMATIYSFINDQIYVTIESAIFSLVIIYVFLTLDKNNKLTTENNSLKHLSTTDQLTGLYNRNKIEETFNYEKKQAIRYHTDLSLILMDLDHFKNINDNHGHNIGDVYLQEISRELKDIFRETDVIGRWGGEEFLILLPKTDLQTTQEIAERLRRDIEQKLFAGLEHHTASFGISVLNNNETLSSLVDRADKALYSVKENGRNGVKVA
ncbi:GGDEF domain-containing protein [Sulfurimonas sp.]|nr:GGDEF domain-containing protein [Sulfurimonas sp.]